MCSVVHRYTAHNSVSRQLPLLLSILTRTYADTQQLSLWKFSLVCMLHVLSWVVHLVLRLPAVLGALDPAAVLCLLFSNLAQLPRAKIRICIPWPVLANAQLSSNQLYITYIVCGCVSAY